MLLVGFFVIRTQGHVSGQEFSPTHFQTREFSFYEIPLLHMQITPIRRTLQTGTVGTYLRQKSLIVTPPGPADVWHLAQITRGLTGETPADASFLTDPLQMEFGGNEHWRQWSMDHPKRAAVLWPQVQKIAKRELYLLIPSLLDLVSSDVSSAVASDSNLSAPELQTRIDRHLQREYLGLILDMQAAGRHQLAADLLAEARADYPENRELAEIK